ncbi:MAG: hypothetical protein ACK4ND_12555 [Cytophagaceae bacterium]
MKNLNFIVNEKGEKTAIVLPIQPYGDDLSGLLEALEGILKEHENEFYKKLMQKTREFVMVEDF